jgi:hypothetical protein
MEGRNGRGCRVERVGKGRERKCVCLCVLGLSQTCSPHLSPFFALRPNTSRGESIVFASRANMAAERKREREREREEGGEREQPE